ncbi:MAG: hypothetical protein M3256_09690 [Actinomycetota bacterium]|nr:hypothetical protein [Actinomycetota bacterium]
MKDAVEGTDDQFRAQIEPIRVSLLDLVEQTRGLRETAAFLPAADSPAMDELAQEPAFAGAWAKEPVRDAHSTSWLFLNGAEDLITAMCRLFADPTPTVYAHVVLARSALECCARAAWLAEPGIGVKRRVARGLNERLYSLAEQAKLPGAPQDPERRRRILDEAKRQSFARLSSGSQSVVALEERRKGGTAIVKWLFENAQVDLGEVVYRFWSSVAHGTIYGLVQSLDPHVPQAHGLDSLTTVGMAVRTDQVQSVMAAAGIAYAEVGRVHRQLFGWRCDDWDRTMVNFLQSLRTSPALRP